MLLGIILIGAGLQALPSIHGCTEGLMQGQGMHSAGNTVRYTGHGVNTGGLQAHSVGPEYPYTIIGVQRGAEGALRWAVMDTRNAQISVDKATYKECEIELYSLKLRNMMHS